jgi:hypothetical protein
MTPSLRVAALVPCDPFAGEGTGGVFHLATGEAHGAP